MITLLLILFAVIGQAGDVLTTSAGLRTGLTRELNPIARYGYERYGIAGLVALKLLYIVIAFAAGSWGLLIAGLLGVGLTVFNMNQLRKAGYFK
jgi:hypothetical protein